MKIEQKGGDLLQLTLRVTPRASRTEITGTREKGLNLRVQAPPVKGAANKECIKFLAKTLRVSKGSVSLVRGLKSRTKVFEISGIALEEAKRILESKM